MFSFFLEKLFQQKEAMDLLLKGMNGIGDESECPFDVKDIQRCPFLRNINKPTNFSFSSTNISIPVSNSSTIFVPFPLIIHPSNEISNLGQYFS